MAKHEQMPKYHQLMNPLLAAMHELGGSGSIDEISAQVTELLDLPEEVLVIPHDPEKSSLTEVEYQLAWARTYLKKYGILDNSSRGVWVIVPEKRDITEVDPQLVVKTVREMTRKEREARPPAPESEEEIPDDDESWRTKLHHVLTQVLTPDAFERLVKRMLRESGFVQVEVTGRSGDGGIDGKGILPMQEIPRLCFFRSHPGLPRSPRWPSRQGALRDYRNVHARRHARGYARRSATDRSDRRRSACRQAERTPSRNRNGNGRNGRSGRGLVQEHLKPENSR